ncbi:MAG: hypothetical protein Q9169_008190 [Polycauliona sp. 2 TL-2023]
MHVPCIAVFAALAWQSSARPSLYERSDDGFGYESIFASGLSANASFHYPSQADYNTSTVQRYSYWEDPTFAVTIKPATERDVQLIVGHKQQYLPLALEKVRRANRYNKTFFATGGGHGAEPGFATVQNAVNIDLSNFLQNDLDVTANTLTVGPGIAFKDFEENLYNAGKLMPVGNIYCVNMIGATVGATVGPYQGLVGLAIDYLLSVRLITAAGNIVTASETENPGLFWAIRGAGANFGIIVSAKFKVTDAPNKGNLISADFDFPASANLSLFNWIQSTEKTFPKEMGFNSYGGFNRTTNQTTLTVAMSYFGPQAAAQPILNQLIAIGPLRWVNRTIPWSSLSIQQNFGASGTAGCFKGVWNNHYTVGANQTDAITYSSAFTKFAAFQKARPWFDGLFVIQRTNTEVTTSLPKSQQGVYPGREISTFIILDNYYDGPAHDEEVYNFSLPLRDELVATSGFKNLTTYINYAFGDEGPEVWYGKQNLPRLVRLKNRWDPSNRFGAGNPIPLSLD